MSVILDPVRDLLITVAHWIPQLVGALLILLIGYIIAKAVESIVRRVLHKIGFDRVLKRGTAGSYIERVIKSPSGLTGSIIFWLIWIGALAVAVTTLGVPALTNFVNVVYGYVPNIIAALLIFVVAGAISGAAATLASRLMGDTPTGKLVATIVPALTMLIAVFMILEQLKIATAIVTITYTALVGAVSLGMALAFGLGGREVAARLLEQAYQGGQRGVQRAQQDVQTGKARASQAVDTPSNPLES